MTMLWPRLRPGVTALLVLLALLASRADAQEQTPAERPADRPAFSLSSGDIFTSASSPYVTLTFERLGSLDFRIYRVADPVAFFASLDDAHTLGSEEYTVPTEQTWLERLASWKAGRRADLQSFMRRQVTREYRAQRRAGADRATVHPATGWPFTRSTRYASIVPGATLVTRATSDTMRIV